MSGFFVVDFEIVCASCAVAIRTYNRCDATRLLFNSKLTLLLT